MENDKKMQLDVNEKSLFIFGRDVSKIPCFRNSLLYGIGGGITCGLVRFLFTSQVLKSSNFAVYSFSVVTLGYWIQCRYKFSKSKFEMLRMQELLREHALLEGTAEEQKLDEEIRKKSVDV